MATTTTTRRHSGPPAIGGAAILPVISVVLILSALIAATPAGASTLTVWAGPGCTGATVTYRGCGCFNITLQGGFDFVYSSNQAANFYCLPNCGCRFSPTHLNVNTRSCSSFQWRSIDLFC